MLIKLLCLPTYVPIFYEYMNVLSFISCIFVEGRDDYRLTLSNLYFCFIELFSKPIFKKFVKIVLYLVRATQMEEF